MLQYLLNFNDPKQTPSKTNCVAVTSVLYFVAMHEHVFASKRSN
jgi:hypothetical protein